MEEELKEEKKKLKIVLELATNELENTKIIFEKMMRDVTDEYSLIEMEKSYYTKIKNLQKAEKNPYFARVDFIENKGKKEKIYIGKTNIFDDDLNVAVVDWRAPVSSIYYDGQIGNTKYLAPEGLIEGKMTLKRQYEIEEGELLNYNDIDITTNDSILQEALKENSDIRLKNIIATIQAEQNKIIRSNMFKPLIVQGVAGSGKTTVALHRIAYLVYTYEKSFNPDDFLIIAPNKFFLDYISNVLPDLGVDYVRQETFEELAKEIIQEKIEIQDSNQILTNIVNKKDDYEVLEKISNFKSSIYFKNYIDKYLKELNENILRKEDFKILNINVIKYEELQKIFLDDQDNFPLISRLERLKIFIQKRVSDLSDKIVDDLIEQRKQKLDMIPKDISNDEQLKQRKKIFEQTENEISSLLKNKGKKLVIEYMNNITKLNPIKIYKEILNNDNLKECTNLYNKISKSFNEKIKKRKIEYEDLAPIMYIKYKTLGINEKFNLKHIIIDEAQDFSEFQFNVLYEILNKNKSMTILGDIAQGIYSYRGTSNWDRINELIFNNEANIEYLNESYRTTIEVMEEANKVIEGIKDDLNINLAIPVSRHGNKVNYINTVNEEEKIDKIQSLLDEQKEKYKNIAIITKDNQMSLNIYSKLKDKYNSIELISDKIEKFNGGITVIPSYFSKGLEFDSVIIADYNSYDESILDKKLLYVAMTRAMHRLDIFK